MRLISLLLPLMTLMAWSGATAAPLALAETDVGVVSPADLEFQIATRQDLPDAELVSENDWSRLPGVLRRAAFEQILSHLAETTGLNEDPAHRAWIRAFERDALMAYATGTLIINPARPTVEEIHAYVDANRDRMRLPPEASWRFMFFEARPDDPESERAEALLRAQLAREALLEGQDFEAVAERLSTHPSTAPPGALIGPTELVGQIIPSVEEAVLTLPIGDVSEPIETPMGPMLVRVEGRDTERYPSEETLIWNLGMELRERNIAERREQVMEDLAERYPVEIHTPLSVNMPDDTPALTVGPIVTTLGDLRLQSHLARDPEAELAWLITPHGRETLIETRLLCAEMVASGVAASPEFQEQMATQLRFELADRLESHFSRGRGDPLTQEEIESHFAIHAEDFIQEVVTVEAMWISHATLGRLASSELGVDLLRAAVEIRQRLVEGEDLESLAVAIGMDETRGDGWERWERRTPDRVRASVRDIIAHMAPGQTTNAILGPAGAVIVRLIARENALPQLEDVQHLIRSEIAQSRPPLPSLMDELLEEYHYRQIVDHTLLRWDESGEHIILIEEED